MTSRCVYCGSTNYGSGCRYSPKGIHFHPEDPKHCAYCGSSNYGKGCRYSPDGIHIHGVQYNGMLKDSIDSMLGNNILLYTLNKPFTEFEAYKLNLIDEDGKQLRKPVTEQELKALNPEIQTLLFIKRNLSGKIDILNSKIQLESILLSGKITTDKELFYKEQIEGIYNDLAAVVEHALHDGVPLNTLLRFIKE